MLHYNFTEHSKKCDLEKKESKRKTIDSNKQDYDWLFSFHIPCRIETRIFFLKGQFVLITMNSCVQHIDSELGFMEFLINNCLEYNFNVDKKLICNVERSCDVQNNWKNETKRNQLFNDRHQEVNHIYHNAAGKEYAICTTYDFGTYVSNRIELYDEYKKTKKYIEDNFKYSESLKQKCDELYNNNSIYALNDQALVVRTINELISNIKNQIK